MEYNGIVLPKGYQWIIDKKIVGFCEFTQLEPWYFLHEDDFFWANEKWENITEHNLLVFARRQDNDDLACFNVNNKGILEVYLIHGWVNNGFEIVEVYSNIWSWLHTVLNDIEEWVNV